MNVYLCNDILTQVLYRGLVFDKTEIGTTNNYYNHRFLTSGHKLIDSVKELD